MSEIKDRLAKLRAEMNKLDLDAVYISGTDPHASEYLPDSWQTRRFISGFTGSYGMVVVTKSEACLWTDTRYFLQAEEQLKGTGINMQKLRVPEAILPEEWLAENLESDSRVGADTQTVSTVLFKQFSAILSDKKIELVQIPDLFDKLWPDRPGIPETPVFELKEKYAGLSRGKKQELIAQELKKTGAELHVISTLDELAWTFNLRGSDVVYNPVFMGFGLTGKNESHLFISKNKLSDELKNQLKNEGVLLHDYNEFYAYLSEIKGRTVFIDSGTANYAIYESLKGNKIKEDTSKVALLKARKNEVEIEGFKQAMKKDGVALVEFLHWLKSNLGKTPITEYTVGRKLAEFRAKQPGFMGESFAPIVGYKAHGAIVHLNVDEKSAFELEPDGILLFDSGGQYLQGTTDITRTVALGKVTEQQKKDFTLVLKGMIGLTRASFPYGTKGCHLDILARKPLWENNLNYGHGTGHGVGHFLNVHEGPMAIRQEYNPNNIEPGQVLSNEPAFYREGQYGIRTENMMVCVEKEESEFGRFLGFETLTLCPIDTTLIEIELLNKNEIAWLNTYHQRVRKELLPLIKDELKGFLSELTQSI
jgi:Xaa-Pro aminopeptidase